MKTESFSIAGRNHTNEDRLAVMKLGDQCIAAVLADGMGGLSLGDMAAEVVTQSSVSFLKESYKGVNEQDILHKALDYADREVRRMSLETKSNMGAAVVLVLINGKQLHCTWQGNVRLYVRHGDKTELLTTDHVADIGYGRTALTRCIKGAGLREDVPYLTRALSIGNLVCICTDGMYRIAEDYIGVLSTDELKERLLAPEDDASMVQIFCE